MNLTQTRLGAGRGSNSNHHDEMILNRKINHPELLFNQFSEKDLYFEEDSSEQWQLSNNCFICEKHRYTLIFYDKNSYNSELNLVTDQAKLRTMKECMRFSYAEKEDTTPVITGSVINNCVPFSKKLKMMRADLFALACISHSDQFITHINQQNALKRGVAQLL